MLGTNRGISRKIGRGLLGLSALAFSDGAWAQNLSYSDASKNLVSQLSYRAAQHDAQISAIISNRDNITDSRDMTALENYYNQARSYYIADPVREILTKSRVDGALNSYINDVRGQFLSDEFARDEAKISGDVSALGPERVKACIMNRVNLSNLSAKREQVRGSLSALQNSVSTQYTFRSMGYIAESRWGGRTSLEQGLEAFDLDLKEIVNGCCTARGADQRECPSHVESAERIQESLRASLANVDYPPMQYTPNPLEVNGLAGQDLAEIIRHRRSTLQTARSSPNEEYADEQDVFESMAMCRQRAKNFQAAKRPLAFHAAFAAAKAIKCSLLPAYAAQNLETQWAKLSVAASAVPIEGKDWDVNCSASEAAAWNQIIDQTRDPNAWGIQQMANPPYIASLRMIPPVTTGLPTQGMTADEYFMFTPTPGINNFDSGANNLRTVARSANSQSGVITGSRSGISAMRATRSDGGVAQGQGLVSAVRASTSSIRNNDRPAYYANRLSSGVKTTLSFLDRGVSRSKLSTSGSSTASTDSVRRMVLRTTGTRASRTTSEGILNSLNGSTSTVGSITDITAQNNQVREQVKGTVTKYLGNIELARVKAQEARGELLRLVGEYDRITAEVGIDIQNQPPKKIAKLVAQARAQHFDIVKQLGVKRAEFDAYQSQIMEQSSALQRLASFGPQGTDLTGLASTTTGSTTTRGSVRTNTGASSGTDMPAGLDTSRGAGVRGASLKPEWIDQLWATLNPISSAWAATGRAAEEFERFYAHEWKRFVSQFGDYVGGLRKQDAANAVEAGKLIASRKSLITEDNYTVIDIDTLTTIDMFISEVDQETEYLLEGQRSRQFSVPSDVLSQIQETRKNALRAQELWAEAQVIGFKSQPKSYEDDARLWWGFLPEILLQ